MPWSQRINLKVIQFRFVENDLKKSVILATWGCKQYNTNHGYEHGHPYFATSRFRNIQVTRENITMLRLGVLGNNDGHVRLAPTGFPYDETEMNEIGRLEPVCSSTRLLSNQLLTSIHLFSTVRMGQHENCRSSVFPHLAEQSQRGTQTQGTVQLGDAFKLRAVHVHDGGEPYRWVCSADPGW